MDSNLDERLVSSEAENSTDLKWRVWEESSKAWRIAFPAMLAKVTAFGMLVVTQSFVGHISELDLSAFALTQTILVRFSNGILVIPSCLLYSTFHVFPAMCLMYETSQLIHET